MTQTVGGHLEMMLPLLQMTTSGVSVVCRNVQLTLHPDSQESVCLVRLVGFITQEMKH